MLMLLLNNNLEFKKNTHKHQGPRMVGVCGIIYRFYVPSFRMFAVLRVAYTAKEENKAIESKTCGLIVYDTKIPPALPCQANL